MGASGFMIYHWLSNPGFNETEYFFGPLADFLQIGVSMIYMYACISGNYLDESFIYVNATKLFQASILPYFIFVTFKKGPRHDMFTAGFAFWKFFFNLIDASYYMDKRFDWINKFKEGLSEYIDWRKS